MSAASLVMVPVTPAVAAVLHAMQAEAIEAAEQAQREIDALRRKLPEGAAIVLPLPERFQLQTYDERNGYRTLAVRTKDYRYELSLQTGYRGDPEARYFRPGLWYGSEKREGMDGRTWSATCDTWFVMDDFGALVPVARR